MTNEKRLQNWQILARATGKILEHGDTPDRLIERIHDFVEATVPADTVPENGRRRLLAYGESLAAGDQPSRTAVNDTTLSEWFGDFGDALADILADERTPEHVSIAVRDLLRDLTEWAEAVDPQARRRIYTRRLLPGLLEIVSEDDGDDSDGVELQAVTVTVSDDDKPTEAAAAATV